MDVAETTTQTETDVNEGTDASTAPKTVPVENRIAEMNRKFNNLSSNLNEKIDQLINFMQTTNTKTPVENTTSYSANPPSNDVVAYTDTAVGKIREELLIEKQKQSFEKALELFPELDPKSDIYDSDFYTLVDAEFKKQAMSKDPNAPLKAAKLVALDQGKLEKLQRNQVLADESRRTRMLSEGGNAPNKASKTKSAMPDSLKQLSQLFGVKTESVEKLMKSNPGKYGMGE